MTAKNATFMRVICQPLPTCPSDPLPPPIVLSRFFAPIIPSEPLPHQPKSPTTSATSNSRPKSRLTDSLQQASESKSTTLPSMAPAARASHMRTTVCSVARPSSGSSRWAGSHTRRHQGRMHLRDDTTLAYNINFPNEKHLIRVREGACHLLTPLADATINTRKAE